MLNADHRYGRGSREGEKKLAVALAPNVREAFQVDHSDSDSEDDARQHAPRQILKRLGQRQKHDGDDHSEGKLSRLDCARRRRSLIAV